jgi:hypothetical protein
MAAFKRTSELLNIGATIDIVDGTPSHVDVNLPLSTLDREVFVVTDVQMDMERITAPAAPGFARLNASVNKTKEGVLTINDPNCVGTIEANIETTAVGHVYQMNRNPDESSTGVPADYLTVIATPDFVLSGSWTTSAGGASNKGIFVRLTGFRAVASADLFAALVTEELNQ